MKKQNSNQNLKAEKMVVLVKTFDHCHHEFQLFQLPCKIVKNCNHEFTNHGYLHSGLKSFIQF